MRCVAESQQLHRCTNSVTIRLTCMFAEGFALNMCVVYLNSWLVVAPFSSKEGMLRGMLGGGGRGEDLSCGGRHGLSSMPLSTILIVQTLW